MLQIQLHHTGLLFPVLGTAWVALTNAFVANDST